MSRRWDAALMRKTLRKELAARFAEVRQTAGQNLQGQRVRAAQAPAPEGVIRSRGGPGGSLSRILRGQRHPAHHISHHDH
jgi:hypothetical protein